MEPTNRYNPIISLSKKIGIPLTSVAKNLGVSRKMLYNYIENPMLLQCKDVMLLASMFGVKPDKLFICLMMNKINYKEIKDIETSIKTA